MAEIGHADVVAIEEKYSGWCTLSVASIRLANGHTIRREVEDHGESACVLPYDPARRTALIIRQLRAPPLVAGRVVAIFEAPAGLIDPGEDAAQAARREVLEETGARLSALEPLGAFWALPGISTERMNLFLGTYAQADRIGPGGGEETEQIEVVEMPLNELAAMVDRGGPVDLKTVMLTQTLRLRRSDLFTPA